MSDDWLDDFDVAEEQYLDFGPNYRFELGRAAGSAMASWPKMGEIRDLFDQPDSIQSEIDYAPVKISRKRNPDTGEITEGIGGGPFITLDPPFPMKNRTIGKISFLTWTSKMSAASFSIPGGPMKFGGTCPASQEESVKKAGQYLQDESGAELHERIPENGVYTCDRCVTGDALLPVKGRGLLRMDQVVDEVLRGARLEVLADHGWTRITKAWERGLKKIVTVRSTCGHELRCTPDHKILTTEGWKEAQELEEADRIIVSPKYDLAEERWPKRLEITKVEATEAEIVHGGADLSTDYPTEWTREVGIALGYLLANGSVSYKRYPIVGLCGHPDDSGDLREVASWINGWCGSKAEPKHVEPQPQATLKTGIVVRGGVGTFNVAWRRLSLVRFLDACGFDKRPASTDRRVPVALFTAPQEAVAGFISGMFSTDGSVLVLGNGEQKGRISLSLASVSKGLLQDVQLLLSNFGIRSTICEYKTSNEARVLVGYSRLYKLDVGAKDSVAAFRDLIGLHNKRKAALLNAANLEYAKPWSTRRYAIVKSVEEETDEVDVYDIEVEHDNHRFVANGLVIKNCYTGKNNYLMYKQVSVGQVVRRLWVDRQLKLGYTALAQKFIEVIASLQDPSMEQLEIRKLVSNQYFRIHDSGDFHKPEYYLAWREVCFALPQISFWAPTRQWVFQSWRDLFRNYPPPDNLALRPSGLFFGARAPAVEGMGSAGTTASSDVHGEWQDVGGVKTWNCPAYAADKHSCASAINPDGVQGCRSCWNRKDTPISYKAH